MNDFYSLENFKKLSVFEEYNPTWIGPGSERVWSSKNNQDISYYDLDGYYITKDVGDKKIINKNINFEYKINKHGFRSQHFKNVNTNKISVLTSGCSQSFGEGMPETLRWQYFLLNDFIDKNVDHFDMAAMGASSRLIIRNIFTFIRNYGKPNYIFIVFPDIARNFMFHDNNKCFQNVTYHTKSLTNRSIMTPHYTRYALGFHEHDAMMSFVEDVWALEQFCELTNIKLFWTTQDSRLEELIINNIKVKNFVVTNNKDLTQLENINNLEYWDIANDNAHRGSSWTSYVAKKFIEQVLND